MTSPRRDPIGRPESRTGSPGDGRSPEGIAPELATGLRLVILDVDGVLTDAGVYMGVLPDGERIELKRFDIQDGLGVRFLLRAGLEVAVVSGRVSGATSERIEELGIREIHQDPGARKLPFVRDLLERKGIGWKETAMLADDLPDLAVFRRVGLPAAVANAQPEIRRRALWTASRSGGRGAVREFARVVLEARGQWDGLVEEYVTERDVETTAGGEG